MVQKSQETKKPICIMMFDMDHFKQVNDTYGHPAGDAVLKTLASVLKASFRVTDLIARYGGEEFIVLLNNIDLQETLKIAEKTRVLIEATEFAIPDPIGVIHKTTSIGVVEYNQGDTVEEFVSKVDKALYEAKETGRNKVVAGK
jgi:two-component system cell cycle response regulator